MRYLLLLSFFILSNLVFSQHSKSYFKQLDKAQKYFQLGDYTNALPLYQELYAQPPIRAEVSYAIGYIFLKDGDPNKQIKSLSYLEYAWSHKNDTVPVQALYLLARSLHLNHQFERAEKTYIECKKVLPKNSAELQNIDLFIKETQNGQELMAKTKELVLQPIPEINTEFSEQAPLINGEDNALVYTIEKPKNMLFSGDPSAQLIKWPLFAQRANETEKWGTPQLLEVTSNSSVEASGFSADGRKLFLRLASNGGDLYQAELSNGKILAMSPVKGKVNSSFDENSGSISADGKTLYFSSNRPHGQGGYDIYRCKLEANGSWGAPENLGPTVNTSFDEHSPFIHPSGKFLFFHSNNDNSIGGYDLFRSVSDNGKWAQAKNMGYPINSAFDEKYFTMSPDGKKGYFSSDRTGGKGHDDLYFLGIPEEEEVVALTMVKGQIIEAGTGKPIKCKINVVDKETGQQVQNVYHPDKFNGFYLLIFPPGKNYDMFIQAEGYTPYALNVFIPNQTYFYELYQQIEMKAIKQFDKVVGQEVNVKNAFFDTGDKGKHKVSEKLLKEHKLVKDSLDLEEMLDLIIASEDKEAFEYFLDILFMDAPSKIVDFANDKRVEGRTSTFFEDEVEKLSLLVLGNDTLRYANMNFKEETREKISLPEAVKNKTYSVFFSTNSAKYPAGSEKQFDEVLDLLRKYPSAILEISGFADASGNEKNNLTLSNQRAQNVLNYFVNKGVQRRRVLAKGYGQIKEEGYQASSDASKNRKVEIRVVE